MGRRSINTTKSGKYMNPTDQARKEARKKELKKNKKQRQMVRAAVLKGKDPSQILEEMEKIDEMEFNVFQQSPLNEKVLREKRKKLKETFDRVMRLYHNDDPEAWADFKRKEVDYEKRRNKKVQYFESVKHAQTVQVDEIPLPQINSDQVPPSTGMLPSARIPLPNLPAMNVPPPLLKKPIIEKLPEERPPEVKKKEPSCPPFPAVDLLAMRELDSDYESEDEAEDIPMTSKSKVTDDNGKENIDKNNEVLKPNSLQQRMLAISGQNIDEFMKEMENVHKKRDTSQDSSSSNSPLNARNSDSDDTSSDDASDDEPMDDEDGKDISTKKELQAAPKSEEIISNVKKINPPVEPIRPPMMHSIRPQPITMPPPPPVGFPTSMMYRPPIRPGIPGMAIRMPPGPPPGLPPRLGIRMPPGPPPGLPPNMHMHNQDSHHKSGPIGGHHIKDSKGVTTITAKPQIRNLSADIRRFVPSTLRTKKEGQPKPKPRAIVSDHFRHPEQQANKAPTKDDAYTQFMKEMQGLL